MQGNLPLSNLILRVANPTLELSRGGLSMASFTLAFGKSFFTLNLKFSCCSGSSYLSLLLIQTEERESKSSTETCTFVYLKIMWSASHRFLFLPVGDPDLRGLLTHFPISFSFLQSFVLFFVEAEVPVLQLLSCLVAKE